MYKYILLIAIWIAGASCGNKANHNNTAEDTTHATGNEVRLTPEQLKNAGIVTGSPAMRSIKTVIKANGTVDVPPQSMISVSFPLGGYLKNTSLLPGSSVHKGEVIAMMEDQSYVQLQQDYLSAKARMEFLSQDMQRQKELSEANASSKKVFQQVLSEYKTQEVLLKSLEEKLRIIDINPAKLNVQSISRDVPIYSPITGYVAKVNVNIGKYVTPSDVLFELVNPDDLHAAITVFEKDIAFFHAGIRGKVAMTDQPGKQYDVEVVLVTRNVDDNRSGILHCHFMEEHNARQLLPGMYLSALFELDNKTVPAVPEEAVVRYGGKEYVFTTTDGKQFQLTEVQTGGRENGYVELMQQENRNWLQTTVAVKGAYSLLGALKNRAEED